MSNSAASLALLVLWAWLYLPRLGTLELKGDEGRRALPAIHMLQSGDWIVPHHGGEPYLAKPPGIYWAIAASFAATGAWDEASARLPVALGMLLLGLGLWFAWRPSVGPATAWIAAIVPLTAAGLWEKGRLAEIEAFYVLWFGLGWAAWFAAYQRNPAGSACWLAAAPFLAAGLLTKGPLHLAFFYTLAAFTLHADRRLQQLASRAHALGLALTCLPFALWAWLQHHRLNDLEVSSLWAREMSHILTGEEFRWQSWAETPVHGLLNYLPWLLLFPLFWSRHILSQLDDPDRRRFIAIRNAVATAWLAISLPPGGEGRYTLGLLVPLGWLTARTLQLELPPRWLDALRLMVTSGLAIVIAANAAAPLLTRQPPATIVAGFLLAMVAWIVRAQVRALPGGFGIATGFATAFALALGVYYTSVIPAALARGNRERKIATSIATLLPPAEPLFAVRPKHTRFLFHLARRTVHLPSLEQLPARRPAFVLVKDPADLQAVSRSPGARHLGDYEGRYDAYRFPVQLWALDAPKTALPTTRP